MIFCAIYARQSPFDGEDPVCQPRLNKRPNIPEAMPPKMDELMKKCWSANAFFRPPSSKNLDFALVELSSSQATEPLETAADKLQRELKQKQNKTMSLYDAFPKHVADALKAGKKVEAESHEIVTVFFSDIVGFSTISEQYSPMKISKMLDRLYHAFDELSRKHGIFKVETIGDTYKNAWTKKLLEFVDEDVLPSDYGVKGPDTQKTIDKENFSGKMKKLHTEVMYLRGHHSCTYEVAAGEELAVTIFTRSTAGAKFTLTDANHAKAPWVENFEVKHNGTDDMNETPSHMLITKEHIIGPASVKVKADSNAGRWSTHNFLIAFSVYNP